MSWSIGPFIGKRDAVMKKVQAEAGYGDTSQLDKAKSLILGELEQLPAERSVTVQGWGHHDAHSRSRNCTISINQLVSSTVQTPTIVE